MLFAPSEIKTESADSRTSQPHPDRAVNGPSSAASVRVLETADQDDEFVVDVISAPSMLGAIDFDKRACKHYYSSGAFNLIQLVLYVLKQTGPAHVMLATYSVNDRAITTLRNHLDDGSILSIRFLIDNRVRSISPKPFDHMLTAFPGGVRCRTLHAKVALIWNERCHVDIVGSQNATHNPKLERGTIFISDPVFEFDKKVLEYEFDAAGSERA